MSAEVSTERLAGRHGLNHVTPAQLDISRRPRGRSFSFHCARGKPIKDPRVVKRLKSLAIPPAYREVVCASDPLAHIQAVGRDAAGRLQYRYHPQWTEVREARKAKRLLGLIESLPSIRRRISKLLQGEEPSRELAYAALVALVAKTAIRAGRDTYEKTSGTRGASTLLKSNVTIDGKTITLQFTGKGGKPVAKQIVQPRLAAALRLLMRLPGRRLFQFRNGGGDVYTVRAGDVNAFLREASGTPISLKDFRTLHACADVLRVLSRLEPATSERGRRKQVMQALRSAADKLVNTPTICRSSYVHGNIVQAFSDGTLWRLAQRASHHDASPERLLATLVAKQTRATKP